MELFNVSIDAVASCHTIKLYMFIMLTISFMEILKTRSWLSFSKADGTNGFILYVAIDVIMAFVNYAKSKYQRVMKKNIIAYLYERYGYTITTYRGEVKQSDEGKKWKKKFNRFVNCINGCISFGFDRIFSIVQIVGSLYMVWSIDPKICMTVVATNLTTIYINRNRATITTQLKKKANELTDDLSMKNDNYFSVIGLFGKNDSKLIDRIKDNSVKEEAAWDELFLTWEYYDFFASLFNIIPVILVIFTDLDKPVLILTVVSVERINRGIENIVSWWSILARWDADVKSLLDFYRKNEDKIAKECEQHDVPEQMNLDIHMNLTDDKRVFNLRTDKPINIRRGSKILVNGVSGSGKTTLMRVIASYYNYGGSIGHEFNFHNLREQVCEVFAGTFSSINFNVTVREIMTSIYKMNDSMIDDILETVCLKEWVDDSLGGIDVDIKGNISEGQKLRLSLAVLLTEIFNSPKQILILDEIDQRIESITAKKIIANIFSRFKECTIFTVLHTEDVKTSVAFDQTINISNGLIQMV